MPNTEYLDLDIGLVIITSLASLAEEEVCWWKMSMMSVSRSDIRISMVWSGSLVMGRAKSFMVYMYQQSLLRLPMQYAAIKEYYQKFTSELSTNFHEVLQ